MRLILIVYFNFNDKLITTPNYVHKYHESNQEPKPVSKTYKTCNFEQRFFLSCRQKLLLLLMFLASYQNLVFPSLSTYFALGITIIMP